MERFNLDQLLRHAFAGAIFLVTALFGYPQLGFSFSDIDSSLLIAAGGGSILFFGSLIYVLHRILYHYAIYRLLIPRIWGRPHQSPMDLDLNRMLRRTRKESPQNAMVEWASQVHFLYCITWAVLPGLGSGFPLFGHFGARAGWRLLVFAGLMFTGAVVHNWRYLTYEREIALRETAPSRPLDL